ncbi:Glycine receptor subunit alpha-3-like 2, partial [Homarus americanus]
MIGNYSGQAVLLTFHNMSTFYVISTYVPTLIIVVIGILVFFFPLWNFNERVMVGLTGLLVEATFFSQVSASIPHTAYLKLVDIWFVYCILTLFLVVVALVVIHWLQEESKVRPIWVRNKEDKQGIRRTWAARFNHGCRIVRPIW